MRVVSQSRKIKFGRDASLIKITYFITLWVLKVKTKGLSQEKLLGAFEKSFAFNFIESIDIGN